MFEDLFYDLDEELEEAEEPLQEIAEPLEDYDEPLDEEPLIEEITEEGVEESKELIINPYSGEVIDDVVVFDTVPDAEGGDYEGGEVSVTKRSSDIEYPHLFIEMPKLVQHKLIALQSMLVSKVIDTDATLYSVYLKADNQVLRIGTTTSYALRSILTSGVFQDCEKHIKLNENQKITGDMMFALCGLKI